MKPRLLIVDDDEEIRTQMKWALSQDYDILLAENRPSAVEVFRAQKPVAALLDLGLPPRPGDTEEGFALLSALLALDRSLKAIVITGQNEKDHALRAIGAGAYDFLCKPVDMEELKLLLKRCFYVAQLEKEHREMQKVLGDGDFEGMLGGSPKMQEVFAAIRKVATSDAPVLLLGESGTGKEMAALAVHRRSARHDGPFVAINCGAIPESLLESELFGHEKGSFTGAHAQRKGRIETAAGGTLFLDEIGELPLPLQVKLLRFLQEQRLTRVGGREEIEIDVRIIAATNADLKQATSQGKFREDLYYRLAVVTIALPPLRERPDDVRLLAQSFLQRFAVENGKNNLVFQPDALKALIRYNWPGNVRELENRVKRAVIMADGRRLTAQDLELTQAAGAEGAITLKEARENLEREMIQQTLQRHSGKISSAATELGISRPTLYELMEKLGITRESKSGD
jgi:two-component system NtrC family response regulator